MNNTPILTGKAFFKDARQVSGRNPDSIVLHHKNHLILLSAGGKAENRLPGPVLDRIGNQLV